jgi:hypothetical protein
VQLIKSLAPERDLLLEHFRRAKSAYLSREDETMFKKVGLRTLLLFMSVLIANGHSSLNKNFQSKPETPTVAFCDLLCNSNTYDGKEVSFRAKYISTFEVAAFADSNCADEDNRTWAEFDRSSIKASTKPDVLKKVEEQVYCCMWAGLSEIRETEMLITGIFHKSNAQGYGHDNEYRFMVTVKSVKEIGSTKKIRVPGLE